MLNSYKFKLTDVSLICLTLFYIMMLGGGSYEQLTVTTVVTSAPPKSLYMLQGPFGFKPIIFWIIFRPITIILFLLAVVANWKNSRRKLLLFAFGIDLITTIATFTYFAPETGTIVGQLIIPILLILLCSN